MKSDIIFKLGITIVLPSLMAIIGAMILGYPIGYFVISAFIGMCFCVCTMLIDAWK